MLFWEMIAVCSLTHIKHITSLRGQNEESMHFKIRLTYSKQRALWVQVGRKKGTLDRHCQPTLPHLRGSWGVQEQRTNINGTTRNKNCWSHRTPGCVTQNHTSTDPVARCWKTAKVSNWQSQQDLGTPRPLQEVFTTQGWQNLVFEASFFSSGNLSAQTIEWTGT